MDSGLEPPMLDLYFACSPNGMKLKLLLEELVEQGVAPPHRWIRVRLSAGEQLNPAFLAISPNGKIPAIVDHAPADNGASISVFESAAILQYLAGKTGYLLSTDLRTRIETLQWLAWQAAGLGPMAGQAGWFRVHSLHRDDRAIDRYVHETHRLYRVLDRQLANRTFIAGDDYSIADIACWPWIVSHTGHGQTLDDVPNLKRWFHAIGTRPATRRAFAGYQDPYARVRHPRLEEQPA
jgi:GST-like protein